MIFLCWKCLLICIDFCVVFINFLWVLKMKYKKNVATFVFDFLENIYRNINRQNVAIFCWYNLVLYFCEKFRKVFVIFCKHFTKFQFFTITENFAKMWLIFLKSVNILQLYIEKMGCTCVVVTKMCNEMCNEDLSVGCIFFEKSNI